MIKSYKPKNYWTIEKCIKAASLYISKIDFINNNHKAYNAARRHGWLDECTKHMTPLGSKFKRLIYAFEFPDKSAYIGLTYNSQKRKYRHMNDNDSQVYKHMNNTKLTPNFIVLTDYININQAIIFEAEFLEKYKMKGWKILNVSKTGGLGGDHIIWTKEKCIQDAKNFKRKSDWQKKSGSACNAARKNKWFDECISHMLHIRNEKGFWTKEKCIQEALKYKSKLEWITTNSYSHSIALKNKWIKDCSKHMIHPKKKWTFDKCKSEALKYNTKNEWKKNSQVSYSTSSKNKWIDLIWQSKHLHQHQDQKIILSHQ